jgi:hypothetical protein
MANQAQFVKIVHLNHSVALVGNDHNETNATEWFKWTILTNWAWLVILVCLWSFKIIVYELVF